MLSRVEAPWIIIGVRTSPSPASVERRNVAITKNA